MNDKEKYAKLAELYTALAEGKTLQVCDNDIGWCDTMNEPSVYSDLAVWRIKLEPKGFVGAVVEYVDKGRCVYLPAEWPVGTRVRVTEIIE